MSNITDTKPRNWMPSQQEGRAVFDEWWSSDECGPSWSTTGNDGWRIWCRACSWFEDKVIDNMSAALSAQTAEIGSLRLEVEGLCNQRDSAQRSSMEAKDQLAAQAAELARLNAALARAVVIIHQEFGYTFEGSAEWLFDQTGQHYVINDDPDSIADEKERIAAASAALAQIREARKL